MLSAVQAGMGSTILPKGDLSDVAGYGALTAAAIDPPIYLTASVLCSGDTPLSPVAALVGDVLARFVFQRMIAAPPLGAEWIGTDLDLDDDEPLTP